MTRRRALTELLSYCVPVILSLTTMPVQRQQKITSLFSQNTPESQKNASEATKSKTKPKKPNNPTSVKTDIVISIKTEHMENIVSRVKNHEFRKYNISTNIERMW